VYYHVAQAGAELIAQVVTPRTAELAQHMLVVAPPDLSRFVLSPMPGLLASVMVEVGQIVTAGDEVAVVEAMKMENSLRSGREGTVVNILAAVGDSLAVDQPIVELDWSDDVS
jgi:propionyl-CoA carboxylase alpha chain